MLSKQMVRLVDWYMRVGNTMLPLSVVKLSRNTVEGAEACNYMCSSLILPLVMIGPSKDRAFESTEVLHKFQKGIADGMPLGRHKS